MKGRKQLKHCLLILGLVISSATYALDPPRYRPILSVSGLIINTNKDNMALFDKNMLDQLPQKKVSTHTPWSEGKHIYTGFSPEALFQLVGVQGKTLSLSALNSYTVEIPIEDFLQKGAIFATHMDGVPMTVRNKGPIMVIYPFDDNPELNIETYYGRSIWQINAISIH